MTTNTLKNIDELYENLKIVKKEKIATESGEMNTQIECMAIGIEFKKQIIAAISISYLIFYSNKDFKEKNKSILLQAKAELEKALQVHFADMKDLLN